MMAWMALSVRCAWVFGTGYHWRGSTLSRGSATHGTMPVVGPTPPPVPVPPTTPPGVPATGCGAAMVVGTLGGATKPVLARAARAEARVPVPPTAPPAGATAT